VVRPQHKSHQLRDSLDHHHDHREWRGETTFPIIYAVGFGSGSKELPIHTLCFGKPPTLVAPVLAAGQALYCPKALGS
jgi:hypothetical protein